MNEYFQAGFVDEMEKIAFAKVLKKIIKKKPKAKIKIKKDKPMDFDEFVRKWKNKETFEL